MSLTVIGENVDQIQDEMDCLWSYRTALVMTQSHDFVALNTLELLADASTATSKTQDLLAPNSDLDDGKSRASRPVASLIDTTGPR